MPDRHSIPPSARSSARSSTPHSAAPLSARHRRRLGARHLVIVALLALLGSAGTFLSVTGDASADNTSSASGSEESAEQADQGGRSEQDGQGEQAGQGEQPDSPDLPSLDNPSSPSVTGPTDNGAAAGAPAVPDAPAASDFIDIRDVPPSARGPRNGRAASTGTFTSRCGRNENGHNNPDNFIVTPGVRNGAHHLHDYVGNLSTDAFSTDDSLRAAGTTCARDDRSTYFWPVLRLRDDADAQQAQQDQDAQQGQQNQQDQQGRINENGEDSADGNVGQALTPRSVTLTFQGSAAGRVTAMPEGLRIITGDAKAFTNGTANARAQWTCTGFEDRRTADKYPLCPNGSRVVRLLDFPSCWDGANNDSANHRTHIVFPDRASGRCPSGTQAVPQLQMRLTYAVPAQAKAFAVDSFPEQLHKPVTDHGDFANFMPARLMDAAVRCINSGRRCG